MERFDLDSKLPSFSTFIHPIFLSDNIDVNQDGNFAYTLSSACMYIYQKNAILRFHTY